VTRYSSLSEEKLRFACCKVLGGDVSKLGVLKEGLLESSPVTKSPGVCRK
jgi:hypothetical protein